EYLPPFKRVHIFSDIEGYHFPLQQFTFQALHEGRVPQWDPSMYCGLPFAANVQAALFYPPNWLMFLVTWRYPRLPFKAMEVFTFVHVWAAFLLCFQWLRGRRLHDLACWLGSAAFAFGGYMAMQITHTGMVTGLTWMPLALWGIDEAVEQSRWRPLWK